MLNPEEKRKLQTRLRRVAGQVGGIQRMVDDDRYCVDVLLQIAAARAALDRVGKILLGSHVKTCVSDALRGGDAVERDKKIDELLEVFERHGRG
jgi:DNA-binding FrmR family transcriptional regulator